MVVMTVATGEFLVVSMVVTTVLDGEVAANLVKIDVARSS